MLAFLLLGPGTPMLFQGEEFAASSPFLFFADHNPELAALVREGRRRFLSQFPSLASPETSLPDPGDRASFEKSKLDHAERTRGGHVETHRMIRDLLALRREDPVIRLQGSRGLDGQVLSPGAFVIRYFGPSSNDRLLIVNFGAGFEWIPSRDQDWAVQWSSEKPEYGGGGVSEIAGKWTIPGEAALVLRPAGAGVQLRARRRTKPRPANPSPSNARLAGSGTVGASARPLAVSIPETNTPRSVPVELNL